MTIHQDISQKKQQFDQRGAERVEIYVKADTIVDEDRRQSVTLHNISATGALIEAEQPLDMGQIISIILQDNQSAIAEIIWTSWPLYGCRFAEPLPAAVMGSLKLRNMLPLELDPASNHDVPSELSKRLRQLREEKGFSLAALSRLAGISKPSIWAWETGKTVPRSRSLHALAAALGVSISEILGQNDAQNHRRAAMAWGPADKIEPAAPAVQNELNKIIAEARARIAQVAGTANENVKISIEF